MKKATTLLASLALASLASAGTSAPAGKGKVVVTPEAPCPSVLSYSYLEAGWIHLDQDVGGVLNGGYLDASYEVAPKIVLDGSATIFDENIEQYTVGVGSYFAICDSFHLTGRAGYSRQNSDVGDLDEWYVAPGFRAQLGCNLELWGKIYINFGEDEEKFSYGVGATYHFTQQFGLTVGYAYSEDAWQTQTGLRFSF